MSVTVDDRVPLESIQLGERSFWEQPEADREAAFATLRREDPIRFFPEVEWVPGFDVGDGFWALTRHADVWHVSRHPALFSSVPSIVIPDQNPDVAEFFGSMIALDEMWFDVLLQYKNIGPVLVVMSLVAMVLSVVTTNDSGSIVLNTIGSNGDYRTKRVILEIYDELQQAITTGNPYKTRLAPPPADPRCCHPPKESANK